MNIYVTTTNNNSTAKGNFIELDPEAFWTKYLSVYSLISTQALRVLVMFGSTIFVKPIFYTSYPETRWKLKETYDGR